MPGSASHHRALLQSGLDRRMRWILTVDTMIHMNPASALADPWHMRSYFIKTCGLFRPFGGNPDGAEDLPRLFHVNRRKNTRESLVFETDLGAGSAQKRARSLRFLREFPRDQNREP
jgi:hypothetical protein